MIESDALLVKEVCFMKFLDVTTGVQVLSLCSAFRLILHKIFNQYQFGFLCLTVNDIFRWRAIGEMSSCGRIWACVK